MSLKGQLPPAELYDRWAKYAKPSQEGQQQQGRWEAQKIVLDARMIPADVQTQPDEK